MLRKSSKDQKAPFGLKRMILTEHKRVQQTLWREEGAAVEEGNEKVNKLRLEYHFFIQPLFYTLSGVSGVARSVRRNKFFLRPPILLNIIYFSEDTDSRRVEGVGALGNLRQSSVL